jgi:hypothetical protein
MRSVGNNAIKPILPLCNPNMEVAALRATVQLKTLLIIVMSRGPRFMTVEDPGLNLFFASAILSQNLDVMSSDEDKVHWSSIDCMAIEVVVVVKVGSR